MRMRWELVDNRDWSKMLNGMTVLTLSSTKLWKHHQLLNSHQIIEILYFAANRLLMLYLVRSENTFGWNGQKTINHLSVLDKCWKLENKGWVGSQKTFSKGWYWLQCVCVDDSKAWLVCDVPCIGDDDHNISPGLNICMDWILRWTPQCFYLAVLVLMNLCPAT